MPSDGNTHPTEARRSGSSSIRKRWSLGAEIAATRIKYRGNNPLSRLAGWPSRVRILNPNPLTSHCSSAKLAHGTMKLKYRSGSTTVTSGGPTCVEWSNPPDSQPFRQIDGHPSGKGDLK